MTGFCTSNDVEELETYVASNVALTWNYYVESGREIMVPIVPALRTTNAFLEDERHTVSRFGKLCRTIGEDRLRVLFSNAVVKCDLGAAANVTVVLARLYPRKDDMMQIINAIQVEQRLRKIGTFGATLRLNWLHPAASCTNVILLSCLKQYIDIARHDLDCVELVEILQKCRYLYERRRYEESYYMVNTTLEQCMFVLYDAINGLDNRRAALSMVFEENFQRYGVQSNETFSTNTVVVLSNVYDRSENMLGDLLGDEVTFLDDKGHVEHPMVFLATELDLLFCPGRWQPTMKLPEYVAEINRRMSSKAVVFLSEYRWCGTNVPVIEVVDGGARNASHSSDGACDKVEGIQGGADMHGQSAPGRGMGSREETDHNAIVQ
jgi:hypothetical protein